MTDRKQTSGWVWRLVVAAVLLLLVGLLLPVLFPGSSRVTPAAVARIKVGMTQAEVETTLGGPPGDYRTRPPGIVYDPPGGACMGSYHFWEGDEVEVWISFEDGRVADCRDFPRTYPPIGTVDLLLWRLGRVKGPLSR
jgi:hypothetical protein